MGHGDEEQPGDDGVPAIGSRRPRQDVVFKGLPTTWSDGIRAIAIRKRRKQHVRRPSLYSGPSQLAVLSAFRRSDNNDVIGSRCHRGDWGATTRLPIGRSLSSPKKGPGFLPGLLGSSMLDCVSQLHTSKRSRFMTLSQAATKSLTNFSWESSQA